VANSADYEVQGKLVAIERKPGTSVKKPEKCGKKVYILSRYDV
jgi:hypothetical protein